MTDDEKRLARTKAIKDKFMVGESRPERIKTHMGGKTAEGFTEKINTKMTGGSIDDYLKKKALREMVSEARDEGKRAMKAASKGVSGKFSKGLGSTIGKMSGKIPALGALLGPAVTLALTGNPNEALASGLDSESLGEGSDEVGDMGLSNADRLMAERRNIQSQKERQYADGGMRDLLIDALRKGRK